MAFIKTQIPVNLSGYATQTYVNNAVQMRISSGTALDFTQDTQYGSTSTPETGNFTFTNVGAIPGTVDVCIHNNGSAPTFSAGFVEDVSSQPYATGQLNYIFFFYFDSTHVLYRITQQV